jgi:hypothetical protein
MNLAMTKSTAKRGSAVKSINRLRLRPKLWPSGGHDDPSESRVTDLSLG